MKNGITGNLMKDLIGLHTADELKETNDKAATAAKTDAAADTSTTDTDDKELPGQSIIDLVEKNGSAKKDESKTESKDEPKDQPKAEPASEEDSNDDPDEFFEEDSGDSDGSTDDSIGNDTKQATVEEQKKVSKVIVDDTSIKAEKGDDEMANNGVNIADLMIRFDHEKMTASIAELLTSGGRVINPKLLEVVEFAINNNPNTRDYIAEKLPEFIKEYPDNIKVYQGTVFEVARNIRVKFMLRCSENGNLYESMETFFDLMERENPHLAIEYGRGIKKLQEVWVKTDCNGKIIDQDHLLTEAEVRKIVLDLPGEIRDEACEKLHIPKMVVKKPSKSDKPDNKKS